MTKKPINKEPRLFFPDSDGKYVSEYIPPPESRISFWFKERYLEFRILLGKDIYYWHIRHVHAPENRKSNDIEFIRHVIKDHDQKPSDPIESRHFRYAWLLYSREMQFVLDELSYDEGKEWEDSIFTFGHSYAHGFKNRWFNKVPEPEDKLIYHGLSWSQYQEMLDLLMARIAQKIIDYSEKKGLDPKTGKKLKKKSPKKLNKNSLKKANPKEPKQNKKFN